MAFQKMPTEMVRAIGESIADERDLSALSRTCVRFFHALVPELYKHNHLHHLHHLQNPRHGREKTSAISKAIKKKNMATIERATRIGIDIVKLHHITEAAKLGDVDIFKILWACKLGYGGFEFLSEDEERRDPLQTAIHSRSTEIICTLLGTGTVNTQVRDLHAHQPLDLAAATGRHRIDIVKLGHVTEAAMLGYVDVFKILWACKLRYGGFQILTEDERGREPLLAAIHSSSIEIVRILLETGKVNTQVRSLHANKPLYLAATIGRHQIVRLLLNHGASARARMNGIPPIMAALRSQDSVITGMRHFWGQELYQIPGNVVATVRVLLEHGAEVGYGGDGNRAGPHDQETPLHLAAQANYTDVAELLIAHGADVNAPNRQTQNTPLHYATQAYGGLSMAQTLIKLGANPNARNHTGHTPLALTPDTREPTLVTQFLLRNGADMIIDAKNNTPLHNLGTAGSLDLIRVLIEEGANINAKNDAGQTPLHRLCEIPGNQSLIKDLIDRGASLTILDGNGVPPIGASVTHYLQNMMWYMLTKGADPNSRTNVGLPILQLAISHEPALLVERLLGVGADPEVPNSHGRRALHYAAMVGKLGAMEVLLKHGVPIDAPDANGLTPLMCAIESVTNDSFDFLLERGASVEARDKRMQTPLHKAAKQGKIRAAVLMLEIGADVNAVDHLNQSPLGLAILNARHGMAQILLDQGADEKIAPQPPSFNDAGMSNPDATGEDW